MNPAAPILLFDSGVGGLTVLAELRTLLPEVPVIYFADTAGLPYGEKTEAEIAARVAGLLGRLSERYAPRLITIACNTASTIALGMVREVLHVPIVGTVPAIKPAAELTRTGAIGLLGTAATIRQGYVDRLQDQFARDKRLIRHAAPELVGAAEAVLRGEEVSPRVYEAAAAGLRSQPGGVDIDTVVLACTHFSLLENQLRAALGKNVRLVHGARGIARRIAHLTQGQPVSRETGDFALFTGDPDQIRTLLPALSAHGLERAEKF